MVDDFKKTVVTGHNKEDAHMSTQRIWQRAQHLLKLKSDNIPAWRRKSAYEVLPLDKKLFIIDSN